MRATGFFLVAMFASALSAFLPMQSSAYPQPGPDDDSGLIGDWRGDSICMVRGSACHDEDSLYHVSRSAEKPGWFSVKADKIVDGKPITMGTVECSYDFDKRTLTCEFPRGVLRLTIQDSKMVGTMHLPDGSIWRKISLSKVKP
jgi:hypothetical protein